MQSKGLSKRRIGNVLLVGPVDEFRLRERQTLEMQQHMAGLAPLQRELIQVNYAKAADIAALFKTMASSDSSEHGSVAVDDRTNSIIAHQTQQQLSEPAPSCCAVGLFRYGR